MKAAPSARSWIAAGVRHELLMRAMPAVRHDLAAPLSLMRMQLLMLRRHAKADVPAPPEALAPRVAQLESDVSELSQGIRSLREWEWPAPDAGTATADLTRGALVMQAVGLMRAAFELNGIVLQAAPAFAIAEEGESEPLRWADAVGLRYLLLGALCHLHDFHDTLEAGGLIALSPVEDWGVCLQAGARPATEGAGVAPEAFAPHRAPRHLAIDAVSLQALAEDLGHVVTLQPGALTLDLRRA